ncbi:hypothetical protein JCM21900_003315 [Sporobolomyces salmonicolor]
MALPYWVEQKLVMCLDLKAGSRQSAVSMMHLQPGVLPKASPLSGFKRREKASIVDHSLPSQVHVVNRWPGDATSSKIPSLILYDSRGVAKTLGAEALLEDVQVQANEEGWHAAKWFKLHLHPKLMSPHLSQVYKDWVDYLLRSTKTWFAENSAYGDVIWQKLAPTMVFVVAHPNGWETAQQAALSYARQKAVRLTKPTEQITSVTEAEASTLCQAQVGAQVAGVDTGRSTIGNCVHEVEDTNPKLILKEAKSSDCVQAGAIFPTRQARTLLADKLKSSQFSSREFLDRIVSEWDVKTKHGFAGLNDSNHLIEFGYDKDTDQSCSIFRGRLTLTPSGAEKAFLPFVETILQSIDSQVSNTKTRGVERRGEASIIPGTNI